MSRSRRRTPKCGHCGDTERWDKQKWHKRLRTAVRKALRLGTEMPLREEVSDTWDMNKDGKFWFGGMEQSDVARLLRK